MPINLDMTGVKTTFEPLPPGNYHVVVDEVEETVAKTGNPMLKITLSVLGKENEGRKLFMNCVLVPQSLWVLKQTLLALGWPEDELEAEITLEPADLLDLEAIAVVSQHTFQGKVQNSVEQLVSLDDASPEYEEDVIEI